MQSPALSRCTNKARQVLVRLQPRRTELGEHSQDTINCVLQMKKKKKANPIAGYIKSKTAFRRPELSAPSATAKS